MSKRNRAFEPAVFLKSQGFPKHKNGTDYVNPLTGRKVSKASALNKAAKVLGWKDFSTYKSAFSYSANGSNAYDRFKGYAETAKRPTGAGTKFDQLYKAAFQTNPPFKKRSKQLGDLLTYLRKRNKNTKHQPGETPRKRRK